ncbi:MAG: DnaJ domain-containing protein [Paludibacteraceae bacterium]|nr:DnaJ domain-containing protein [Paludibacteraceae bacterium]
MSEVIISIVFLFTPFLFVILEAIISKKKGWNDNTYYNYTEPVPPSINPTVRKNREKKIFSNKNYYESYMTSEIYYAATLSVIALFSLVIKRDGVVDERELKVANLYLNTHKRYNILFSYYNQRKEDPIAGQPHDTRRRCEEMLKYYNSCANLSHYKQCCENIIKAGIYYEAALDLLNALFQVAYSSDGVINTEREILYGIALELKIRREDWNELSEKYGFYRADSEERDWRDSARNTNQTKYSQYSYSSKGKESSSHTYKNTDGFGEKYQKEEKKQQQEEPKKSASYGYKLTQAYNQLGLLTTASEAEIKSAYRKLVKRYHPDRLSPDATDMERKISADQFRQIKEAYDLIRLEKGSR